MYHSLNRQSLLPFSHIPYTALRTSSPGRGPSARPRLFAVLCRVVLVLTAIAGSLLILWALYDPKLEHAREAVGPIPVIPKEFRTVGLVFYGRRSRVAILDCYLKQNLKENGGLLDEVIFLARTDDVEDLQYLDRLVESSTGYTRRNLTESNHHASSVTYGVTWEVVERETMYIKIDDDIMFIEKNAIASLVATKVAHPEHLLVSTNTINSPRLAWLHSHLGAIHPYLPELSAPPREANVSWRHSSLPQWDGNPNSYNLPKHISLPPPNHRWLPLPPSYSLSGTPITTIEYTTTTDAITNWAVAAQEHYSFLQNLESSTLNLYKFDKWDMQGVRLQVNMIAIWGDDIIDNMPIANDDEKYLTVELPKKLGRHAVVDGQAIAVHYAFRHQRKGLEMTDLLARYRTYAEEMVCSTV